MLKKEYFALKFLLPTIKITCKECNKEFFLHDGKDWDRYKKSDCFSHSKELSMSSFFIPKISSKTIIDEYFNKEDNFISMIISIFLLLFIFFIKESFNLDGSLHIFSFILLLFFLFTYIKFTLHINIERAFKIILPKYNEKNDFFFRASIISAQCNNVSEEDYLSYINSKFRDFKYLYRDLEYI